MAPAWPGLDRDVEAAPRRPVRDRAPGRGRDRRSLRGDHPRTRAPTDHHGALLRRARSRNCCSTASLGAAGVAIDSAAAQGRVHASALRRCAPAFPVLKNPLNNHRAVMLTPEEFHYAFTNTMSEEESRRSTSATPSRDPAACCSRVRSRTSTRTPRRGRLPQRRPRAAAVHRRRRRPRDPGQGRRGQTAKHRKSTP